jgi:hypothetical protein
MRGSGAADSQPADGAVLQRLVKYGRSACLDTATGRNAIAEPPDILMGFKNGRQVFERHSPVLVRPGRAGRHQNDLGMRGHIHRMIV